MSKEEITEYQRGRDSMKSELVKMAQGATSFEELLMAILRTLSQP
jgi:hypothetical protein